MHKYRPFLLLLLISCVLPACMTTDDIFGVKRFKKMSLAEFLTAEPSKIVIPSVKKSPVKSTSALVQAIMEAPSAARSIAAATAAGASSSARRQWEQSEDMQELADAPSFKEQTFRN